MQHLSLIETLSTTTPLRGGVHPGVDPKGDGVAFSKVMQDFDLVTDPQPEELSLPAADESAEETDTSNETSELDVAKDRGQTVDVTAPELAADPVPVTLPPTEAVRADSPLVVQALVAKVETPFAPKAQGQSDLPRTETPKSSASQVISERPATEKNREIVQTAPQVEVTPSQQREVPKEPAQASPQGISVSEATFSKAPEQSLHMSPAPKLPGVRQQAAIWQGLQIETADRKQPNLAVVKFGVDGTALSRPAPHDVAINQTVAIEPQTVVAKPAVPVMPTLGIAPSILGAKQPEGERSWFNPLMPMEIPIGQAPVTPSMDSAYARGLGPNPTAVVQNIAQQMAVSVRTAADGLTELRLAPVELGRVEMRVATTETGVLVQLAFDRTDTQDLVRRHIGDLTAEFRQMGFRDISFAFAGQGGGTAEGQGEAQAQPATEPATNDPASAPVADPQIHSAQTDGLDLRL